MSFCLGMQVGSRSLANVTSGGMEGSCVAFCAVVVVLFFWSCASAGVFFCCFHLHRNGNGNGELHYCLVGPCQARTRVSTAVYS